jgi:hypothetical protein
LFHCSVCCSASMQHPAHQPDETDFISAFDKILKLFSPQEIRFIYMCRNGNMRKCNRSVAQPVPKVLVLGFFRGPMAHRAI